MLRIHFKFSLPMYVGISFVHFQGLLIGNKRFIAASFPSLNLRHKSSLALLCLFYITQILVIQEGIYASTTCLLISQRFCYWWLRSTYTGGLHLCLCFYQSNTITITTSTTYSLIQGCAIFSSYIVWWLSFHINQI